MSVLMIFLGIGFLVFIWKVLGLAGVFLGLLLFVLFWLIFIDVIEIYRINFGTETQREVQRNLRAIRFQLMRWRQLDRNFSGSGRNPNNREEYADEYNKEYENYKNNYHQSTYLLLLAFLPGAITMTLIGMYGWDFADPIKDLGSGFWANIFTGLLSWVVCLFAIILIGGLLTYFYLIVSFGVKELISFLRDKILH